MYDGQYILNHEFKKLFPYVDNMCYFVKCANKKAYLNPCGPATRNDKHGDGFCSHLDLEVSELVLARLKLEQNSLPYEWAIKVKGTSICKKMHPLPISKINVKNYVE